MNLLAPELPSGFLWLNTNGPLRLQSFRGQPVLLFFFTFGSVNCLSVLASLKKFAIQNESNGLIVLGVHSEKFPHEAEAENIQLALERLDFPFPVVADEQNQIWQNYGLNAWPSFVVVDPEGRMDVPLIGEGHFDFLTKRIAGMTTAKEPKRQELRTHSSFNDRLNFKFPEKLCAASTSRGIEIFVADTGNDRIIVLNSEGKFKTALGADELCAPRGLCVLGSSLYVCDSMNHRIVRFSLEDETYGPRGVAAGRGQQGTLKAKRVYSALEAPLSKPWDICVWKENLVIACAGSHQMALLNPEAGTLELMAGTGKENMMNGHGEFCSLAQPTGCCALSQESTAFVDAESSSLRLLYQNPRFGPGFNVETLIGAGLTEFGFQDGALAVARMQHPSGCAYSPISRAIIVLDSYNGALRSFSLERGTLSTHRIDVNLKEPGGIFIDEGVVYIADTNAHRILRFDEKLLLSFQPIVTQSIQGPFGVYADFTGRKPNAPFVV